MRGSCTPIIDGQCEIKIWTNICVLACGASGPLHMQICVYQSLIMLQPLQIALLYSRVFWRFCSFKLKVKVYEPLSMKHGYAYMSAIFISDTNWTRIRIFLLLLFYPNKWRTRLGHTWVIFCPMVMLCHVHVVCLFWDHLVIITGNSD